jgi:hypothetical protein
LQPGEATQLKTAEAAMRMIKDAPVPKAKQFTHVVADKYLAHRISRHSIDYVVSDPIALVCDLLADPKNAPGSIWHAAAAYKGEAPEREREFHSAMHGDKCIRLQQEIPDDCILAGVILYTDDTWVSANGRHSAKPFNLVLGEKAKMLLST